MHCLRHKGCQFLRLKEHFDTYVCNCSWNITLICKMCYLPKFSKQNTQLNKKKCFLNTTVKATFCDIYYTYYLLLYGFCDVKNHENIKIG